MGPDFKVICESPPRGFGVYPLGDHFIQDRNMYRWFLLLGCVLFSLGTVVFGEIRESYIQNDMRQVILFDTFGFDATGHIDMNISDVIIRIVQFTQQADQSQMGFFITTAEAEIQLQQDLKKGDCLLNNPHIHKVCTLHDADVGRDATGVFHVKYKVPEAAEYSLFFASCQPHATVEMKVRLALYNVESSNNMDFLPSGKTALPKLYFICFICYTLAGGYWFFLVYHQWATSHRIHMLMGILIAFKALTVAAQAVEYQFVKVTGTPHGWNIAYYVFGFFRGVMLFTVIVLIGTGWSFLKPFLQEKEKKVIMIVIPLQVFANIATIVLDESGPSSKEWFTWRDIFHLLDIICCCAILFPIVWSIKHLREAAHTDGKAARNVAKLTLFRQFYIMVVSYVYFTRIVVYLLKSTTPYHWAWTADLAGEVATFAFYCFTGYKFRPVETNPYFVLDDDEEAAAQQALKDEEFDL